MPPTASPTLHMLKLCVGAAAPADLIAWQKQRVAERAAKGLDARPRHVTRMWPKRAEELLAGGSLYWVFKGEVLARQVIEDLQEQIGEDGIRRCAIVLGREVHLTESAPRRPFQGWRYLAAQDAPGDLDRRGGADAALPGELRRALADLGVR